jgi:hypothetical protein
MSDERGKTRRRGLRRVIMGSVFLVVLAILALLAHGQIRGTQMLREFGILWNTTDAITVYINVHHKWPRNWNALSPSLIAVGAGESNLRDSVVINFDVDCQRMPQPGDWYVHLTSKDIPAEESAANEVLRRQVVRLSQRERQIAR